MFNVWEGVPRFIFHIYIIPIMVNDFVFDNYAHVKNNSLRGGNNYTVVCNETPVRTYSFKIFYTVRISTLWNQLPVYLTEVLS